MFRSVSIVVAAGAVVLASAQTVAVSVTPTENLTHVEAAFVLDGSSLNFGDLFDLESLPDIAANTTYSANVTLQESVVFPVLGYSLIAVYTTAASVQGATIGFSQAAGSALINSSSPWPFASPLQNETQFISDPFLAYFHDADQAELLMFQEVGNSALSPAAPSTQAQLVNFSNGTNGGTMTAAVVPEPSMFAGLGLGLLALRRRRKSAR
jgi:hypothetical protein